MIEYLQMGNKLIFDVVQKLGFKRVSETNNAIFDCSRIINISVLKKFNDINSKRHKLINSQVKMNRYIENLNQANSKLLIKK